MRNPILTLAEAMQQKRSAVLATVIEVKGASPAKVGAQIVLLDDDTTAGSGGGGKLEAAILTDARLALADGQPRLTHYSLTEEGPEVIGTLCGGEVRVFIQSFLPPPQLIIVGSGHIGRPLKVMGEAAGFNVLVIDVEPGRAGRGHRAGSGHLRNMGGEAGRHPLSRHAVEFLADHQSAARTPAIVPGQGIFREGSGAGQG